jgi:cellulose synthase/poly-beta-1,6-N-acetylglucosamine synthase-like glycosyltransferase
MIVDALDILRQLDLGAFLYMFWHYVIFDFTRYTVSLLAVFTAAFIDRTPKPGDFVAPVSVILAGFNEAGSLRKCALSLREQTLDVLELVVADDGSTDNMLEVAARLREEGLVDKVVSSGIRGGKSSTVNLALQYCSHDIVSIVDIDTSFDRDGFAQLIAPFADPKVGAVSGNLGVRNADATMMTRFQTIEYLLSISLGRRFTSMLGILSIVSGAFGAFRRGAVQEVGGWEVGPGEDADITDKLRRAGWVIRFAPNAWSMTDVPTKVSAFAKQRLRWNRSVIRFRFRKYRQVFNPFSAQFSFSNMLAASNILFYQVLLAATFYIYVVWLFWTFEDKAIIILLATSLLYFFQDLLSFAIVSILYKEREPTRYVLYIFGYGLFATFIQRAIRLYAYLDELIFRRSYSDSYVPTKVRKATEIF